MADDSFELPLTPYHGMVTNADPHDIPPGAMQSQVNIISRKDGQLDVRNGLLFASTPRSSGNGIIAMCRFVRPNATFIVWETSAGDIQFANVNDMSTVTTIGSGYNTFQPMCFAQSRQGVLIGVNGVNRGFRWDGMTTAVEDLGIDAPASMPSITLGAGGGATAGEYQCAFRFLDDDNEYDEFLTGTGNGYPSSFSPIRTVTATASQKFTWGSLATSLQSRVTKVQLWRTTAGQSRVFYLVTEIAYSAAGAGYVDTLTDEQLEANQSMPLFSADGRHDIANRFNAPPNDMPYIAFLQDRLFYCGAVHYNQGTLSTTSGSATITGSGTAWTSAMIGRRIFVNGETTPKTITAYSSATSLTVDSNFSSTASGRSYTISPKLMYRNALRFSEVDEPEAVADANEVVLQENHDDPDEITGIAPNNTSLLIGQRNHIYTLRFYRQPEVDADVSLAANRGMLNNRCWTRFGSDVIIFDLQGAYAFGGGVQPIDEKIGNLWGDLVVSSDSKFFFVVADRAQQYVRFHYKDNGSSSTYPDKWLEYSPSGQQWTIGTYPPGLGHGVQHNTNSYANHIYYGSANRRILYSAEGNLTDGVSITRGTATSATSTTISDSGASFTTAMLDAPVSIISGTGKGQTRYITARTSTQLTVDTAWITTPDTTSVYSIGAIPWSFKTGIHEVGGRGQNANVASHQGVEVIFSPTSGSDTFDMRRYIGRSTTPATNDYVDQNLGDYISTELGSSDTVVQMKQDYYSLGNQEGFVQWRFGGHRSGRMNSSMFVALEFRGFQEGRQITLHDITLKTMQ